jgi:hypothetical protein
MDDELSRERHTEAAVIWQLRRQPLYALELVRAIGGNRREVVAAVERLDADGAISVPQPGARFKLV